MPPIRSSASKRYILFTTSIFFNREIISSYSCYAKKGLVYIMIISSSSYQPSFCSECTKANTYLLCDVYLVPFNKYRFLRYTRYYIY